VNGRCEAGWDGPLATLGAKHDWSGEMYRACHREAVTTVTSGCVHEHVETWKVCVPCQQAIVQRAGHRQAFCPLCPGHKCRVLLSVPQAVAS
jgi:hypothetical protein